VAVAALVDVHDQGERPMITPTIMGFSP